MVHDLFESALPRDYWHWNIDHESDPKHYLSRAQTSRPDIIFLSNRDQQKDYAVVKEIRSQPEFNATPILLLTFAKDKLDLPRLRSIGIQGFIRKPFESSTLLEQIERVLENQGKLHTARSKPQLENLNVIDEDLLGLLSGKESRDVALDELEAELDPTLQLHPVKAESMLDDRQRIEDDEDDESILDDRQRIEDYEDAEYLDIDEGRELFSDDLETDLETAAADDWEADLEAEAAADWEMETEAAADWEMETDTAPKSAVDDEPESEKQWDQDIAETEAIEIELEEISLDFDETETETAVPTGHTAADTIIAIPVVQSSRPRPESALSNISDNHEIGLMEIEVIPFDHPLSTIDEEIVDDLEAFGALAAIPDHMEADELEPVAEDSDLEISFEDDGEIIEIEHTDITDIDDDGFSQGHGRDFDEAELTEISVEGIDDEEFEIQADEETEENLLKEVEDAEEIDEIALEPFDDDTAEMTLAGEDEDAGLEFEFDDDAEATLDEETAATAFMDDDPTDDVDGEEPEDDFDLSEFENLDAESAQMNIQEMINFRQVMKAKYDIPDESADEDVDDADELLTGDEIDDFDLAETPDDAFEEIQLDESDEAEEPVDFTTMVDDDDTETADLDLLEDDDEPALFSDHDPLQDEGDESDEIELLSGEELDDIAVEDLDVDDVIEDIDLLAESANDDESEDDFADEHGDSDVMFETEPMDDSADFDDDEDQPETAEEDNGLFMDELDDIESDETELLLPDELAESEPSAPETEFETIDDLELESEEADPTTAESAASDAFLAVEAETDDDIDLLSDDLPETDPSEDLFFDDSSPDETTEIDLLSDDFPDEVADKHSPEEKADDLDGDPFIDNADLDDTDDQETWTATDQDHSEAFEVPLDDESSFDEAEEVTIEVPQDVFEMGDFRMSSISDELDTDEFDTEIADEPTPSATASDDIDLPSLDEDLPDMPSFADVAGADKPDIEDPFEDTDEGDITDSDRPSGIGGKDIELLQSEEDFEPFPEETTTIRFDKTEPGRKPPIEPKDTGGAQAPIAPFRKPLSKDSKALLSQSVELRNRLSTMIEGLIAETIQNTLHDMLPEMMERIIEEELKE